MVCSVGQVNSRLLLFATQLCRWRSFFILRCWANSHALCFPNPTAQVEESFAEGDGVLREQVS